MTTPRIVAPFSRFLDVADVARSTAFYRDVLGFAPQPPARDSGARAVTDLVSGEARLTLGGTGAAGGDPYTHQRGSAILFLETDDVDAAHRLAEQRGAQPTAIEKVNWIKMRMFQVRDPDGNTVWLGRTFNVEMPEQDGQLQYIMPNFPVTDVAGSIKHYQEQLGFSINYAQHDLGVMYRDKVTLILFERTPRFTGPGACSLYVRDVDSLHEELTRRGANVQGEPVSHPWGLRDFAVLDLEGNRITFSETFE